MDKPARDKRLGWTGDIATFAGTAEYNMRTLTFLSKWFTDLRDEQLSEGAFTDVAPTLQGSATVRRAGAMLAFSCRGPFTSDTTTGGTTR